LAKGSWQNEMAIGKMKWQLAKEHKYCQLPIANCQLPYYYSKI
jgi:hypothetical protein